MNTLIGMVLGCLAGVGYSQSFAAAVEGRGDWLPWLLVGLLATAGVAVVSRWVRLTGGIR